MPVSRERLGFSRAGCALSISLLLSASAFAQPVPRQQAPAADPLAADE